MAALLALVGSPVLFIEVQMGKLSHTFVLNMLDTHCKRGKALPGYGRPEARKH